MKPPLIDIMRPAADPGPDVPPWGTHDTFLGAKGIPGGVLYLYSCPAGNYVSVTLKKDS